MDSPGVISSFECSRVVVVGVFLSVSCSGDVVVVVVVVVFLLKCVRPNKSPRAIPTTIIEIVHAIKIFLLSIFFTTTEKGKETARFYIL